MGQQPQQSPQPQPQSSQQPQMDGRKSRGEKKEEGKEEDEGVKGFFSSFFGDKKDEGEEGEEGEKIDYLDEMNLYLKSRLSDPEAAQVLDSGETIKNIDNLIEKYNDSVKNYDMLEQNFQKFKEYQRIKNFKDITSINKGEDTIQHLTNIIVKLEKSLNDYKKNAEKKIIAQKQISDDESKKALKEKEDESKKIHEYMQRIINERLDTAQEIIDEMNQETVKRTQPNKSSKKRTKKKEKKEKGGRVKKKKRTKKK